MGVIPLVFDNVKLKYKQKANLSDTKLLRPRTTVALTEKYTSAR